MKKIIMMVATGLGVTALAACGAISDAVGEQVGNQINSAVEEQISNAAGEDVDISFGSTATLPATFPSSIPIPDGTLVSSYASPEGWSANFALDGNDTGMGRVVEELKAQGYDVGYESDWGGLLSWQLEGPDYSVVVSEIGDGEGDSIGGLTIIVNVE